MFWSFELHKRKFAFFDSRCALRSSFDGWGIVALECLSSEIIALLWFKEVRRCSTENGFRALTYSVVQIMRADTAHFGCTLKPQIHSRSLVVSTWEGKDGV